MINHRTLSYEELHEILTYDPLTGEVRNRTNRGKAQAGHLHQAKSAGGHIMIRLGGKTIPLARVIWCMMTGEWPDHEVDHKNTIRDDNRWDNLREASESQNRANRNVLSNNRLGVKGVTKRGERYYAHIVVNRKFLHLGVYDTAEDASAAYLEAAQFVHGEFARG